ncbi:hypothetical protein KR222_000205 [Zaprionus bogoriensis]|nr:hypothetical protein KR222_000205 [Zaprionus bogoriensis]
MLRKASLLAAAAVVSNAAAPQKTQALPEQPEQQHQQSRRDPLVCRPSELPIYGSLRTAEDHPSRKQKESALYGSLETGVRQMRQELKRGYNELAERTSVVSDYYHTAKDHTQRSIDFLNEPQNSMHRSGAIVMGGLAGFIFAARGGVIKKIVYTTIGAGTVASLCYPRQAEENARIVLHEGRKIFAVAYNFVKGVKPGDEVALEPFKNFPTSVQDLKYIALDLFDEAKETLFPKKK